ncbi:MAG TPA: M50 family metallopeptidase [Aggregatilinea sp.]|jgi:hypothetical protein|uniref:M50 family metallopeptidase n=1 Tax=Aggregatilinea sp. TaxID=2806333 RepID=UPI002C07A6B8|nr:M50 family metallopeptidase [Aggregatilinea sp.]HML20381.1 M50 family metallopeptidase [Aggregatilinea sp.]
MTTSQPAHSTSPQRDALLAFVAFGIAVVLWQIQGLSILTYPLRLFVTMIHELSHGLAAVLTGGSFLHFEVTKYGAGLAYTDGGSRFVIIQAGYVGTALFGAILLYAANRVRRPGVVAVVLGLIIGVLTLLYSGIGLKGVNASETILTSVIILSGFYLILTRQTNKGRYAGVGIILFGGVMLVAFASWENWLTTLVGIASALVLVIIGTRASRDMALVALNFLAFLTGLQAVTDGWVLLRIVSMPRSMMPLNDAAIMEAAYGGWIWLWAVLWIVLDVVIFGGAIYLVFIRPRRKLAAG